MVITGHRGAAKLEPENTCLSIQKAIELGVDQIEIDVHLTRDQKLVVIMTKLLTGQLMVTGPCQTYPYRILSNLTLEKVRRFRLCKK